MDIAFFDSCGWNYDPETPYLRPLGGSQSALCYLTAQLVSNGHKVTLFNGTSQPGPVSGVWCSSLARQPATLLREPYDAMIVLNGPGDLCLALRPQLDPNTPLVLWTQHAPDQPWMRALERVKGPVAGWDRIVCVSDWHRDQMIAAFGLDQSRVSMIRNAIGVPFEAVERDDGDRPPVLAYTSTPYRGLDVLLDVFPAIRRVVPGVTLEVYSSMAVYQQVGAADPYGALYDRCRAMEGVNHVGSLSQPELAQALARADILAYPCTFAETSCISVMEAMAAGLFVVTTDLGALPETCMDLASLVVDGCGLSSCFETRVIAALQARAANPNAWTADREYAAAEVRRRCTWKSRAADWEAEIGAWNHG